MIYALSTILYHSKSYISLAGCKILATCISSLRRNIQAGAALHHSHQASSRPPSRWTFFIFSYKFISYLRARGAVIEDGAVLPVNWRTTSWSRVQFFHPEDVAESFEVPAEPLHEIGTGDVGREEREETVLQGFLWRFSSFQRDGQFFIWGYNASGVHA